MLLPRKGLAPNKVCNKETAKFLSKTIVLIDIGCVQEIQGTDLIEIWLVTFRRILVEFDEDDRQETDVASHIGKIRDDSYACRYEEIHKCVRHMDMYMHEEST